MVDLAIEINRSEASRIARETVDVIESKLRSQRLSLQINGAKALEDLIYAMVLVNAHRPD